MVLVLGLCVITVNAADAHITLDNAKAEITSAKYDEASGYVTGLKNRRDGSDLRVRKRGQRELRYLSGGLPSDDGVRHDAVFDFRRQRESLRPGNRVRMVQKPTNLTCMKKASSSA